MGDSNPAYKDLDQMLTNPSARRVRVTRVLVYEGSPLWVKETLDRSWVTHTEQQNLPNGSVVQASISKIEDIS